MEYTEEAGLTTGLAQLNTDEQSATKATELSAQQFEAIQAAASRHDGIEFAAVTAITTLNGRHSEIQSVDSHQTAWGDKYQTGPVIDIIPTIGSDGQSVQMMIAAHLNYPAQVTESKTGSKQ